MNRKNPGKTPNAQSSGNTTHVNATRVDVTSGSAATGSAVSGNATPGSATPGSAASGNTAPGCAASVNTASVKSTTGSAASVKTTPDSAATDNATSDKSSPDNATSGSSAYDSAYDSAYGSSYDSMYGNAYDSTYGSSYESAYESAYDSIYGGSYSSPYGGSYASTYGSPYGSSYASTYGNPYGGSYASTYGGSYGSSYASTYDSSYASSYGGTTGYSAKGKKRKSSASDNGSTWFITPQVYEEIRQTIGRKRPEQGGILGSSDGKHIDHYYHDKTAACSGGTYTMNAAALNRVIHEWNDNDVQLIGVIHSHPQGLTSPSAGDMETARQIIETVDVKGIFFTPIVQVSPKLDGTIEIYPYSFERSVKLQPHSLVIEKTVSEATNKSRLSELDRKAPNRFQRIESVFPDNLMRNKKIICIGCGGSRAFLESMARCGVGTFVLWDGDKIEDSNIATQNVYLSEIGRFKCDVIRDKILDINPSAKVKVINRFLDGTVSDEEFAKKTGIREGKPENVLLLGCTDNFFVQDRCAQLAIKYGVPYLAAQIFAGGKGHEVIFSYPDVTTSCPRCMLESRYRNILSSPNAAGSGSSEGAAVCVTDHLNAIKSYMALNILCYNEPKTPYYRVLDRFADRNYLMTKCAGDFSSPAFEPVEQLERVETDLSFPFLTIAVGQTPEPDCPLCGGKGVLKSMKGSIANTRYLPGRTYN